MAQVEFIKETANLYGVRIYIVKETKRATRRNPRKIRFWVKMNDHPTCFFDTVDDAERFAAGCLHGFFFTKDYFIKQN